MTGQGIAKRGAAPRLARLIARSGGLIPFERFMREALYGPFGYYRKERRVGADYHTAPRISPLFGRLLARAVGRLGDEITTIVELGAHTGLLAGDMLPSLPQRMRYVAIEAGEAPREAAAAGLAAYGPRVEVLDRLPRRNLGACVVIANEFFDALPCHRIVQTAGGLQEMHVGVDGARFVERRGAVTDTRIVRYLAQEKIRLRRWQQAEVCLDIERIYGSLRRACPRGVVIVIDYGYSAGELYAWSRRRGTLRTYAQQRDAGDPLERPGEKDITYHVDLTRIRAAAERFGFRTVHERSLAEFLIGLGALDLMRTASMEERLSLKTLVVPGQMGERFTVLVQTRGIAIRDDVFPAIQAIAEAMR
ncbi:MAG: SAM-dependent methyltransferase [Acidobacteriota bacterium]